MPKTKRRMADDRLPYCRSVLMPATNSDKVILRELAISLNAFQNASSRLTLVLWPLMTTECLMTVDFIAVFPPNRDTRNIAPHSLKNGSTIFCEQGLML